MNNKAMNNKAITLTLPHAIKVAMHAIAFLTAAIMLLTTQASAQYYGGYSFQNYTPTYNQRGASKTLKAHIQNEPTTQYGLSFGLRTDEFRFTVPGDPTNADPRLSANIISELEWSDMRILEAKGHVKHAHPVKGGHIVLEGIVTAGTTFSGENRDSDYQGDNRTQEWSRSIADSGQGKSFGVDASIGYQFIATQSHSYNGSTALTFMPVIGFNWDKQEYRDQDLVQVIDTTDDPQLGPFPGLDSHYTPKWQSAYAGLEAKLIHNKHALSLRGEYHDITFDADANWNLRDMDFTTESEGSGYRIKAGYLYRLDNGIGLSLDAAHTYREVDGGTITFREGDEAPATQPFGEGENSAQSIHVGLNYLW